MDIKDSDIPSLKWGEGISPEIMAHLDKGGVALLFDADEKPVSWVVKSSVCGIREKPYMGNDDAERIKEEVGFLRWVEGRLV